ncbi:flap endonuclease-1 [Candidatus Woesearchaeota archaeon]|nr:flap endonuclease-1 [Candidatus Woesearchaeota archaeon]
MGVAITDLLKKEVLSFEELGGKKVAIDSSNVIYQFLSSIRQRDGTLLQDSQGRVTSHLQGLLTRTTNLMKKNVKLVFVFDGKSPELKKSERKYRDDKKKEAEKMFELAKEEGNEELMYKYSRQSIRMSQEIIDESKEFIKALGIPIVQALYEAEAQAAALCKEGMVDYVGSQDADALVFGSPNLLRNLTLAQKRKTSSGAYISINPELIKLEDTLESLGIDYSQFISLAILVGTDFNQGGVKGVGPKNALKIVKEYKKPEKIFEAVKVDFDWKEVYELFEKMKVEKNVKLDWKEIDRDRIIKLLVDEHEFSLERVESGLNFDDVKKSKIKIDNKNQSLGKWF